jgi:hypothetical protein
MSKYSCQEEIARLRAALERAVEEFNSQPYLDFSGIGNDFIQVEIPRLLEETK